MSNICERILARTIADGECLIYQGWKNRDNGYGYARYKGRDQGAHRIMYQEKIGAIPEGMVVMHSCDNPACVNIGHLSIGSQKENMQDKVLKGRANAPKKENHHAAKINTEISMAIRAMFHLFGYSKTEIGVVFGINRSSVSRIISMKSW